MVRLQRHASVAATLSALSDEALGARVEAAPPLHAGIGGRSCLLTVDGVSVFAKQIPLTDLEREPEYVRSTANLFGLPMFCQYGVGGCPGFGAWRELESNLMATGWATTGACVHFPLLYHWRVLPAAKPAPMNAEQSAELERDVRFWENSSAVRGRIEAARGASAQLVLFSEYVPQNLLQWLTSQFALGASAADFAVRFVEGTLNAAIAFMNARGLFHFDAHFENVMTDGQLLYFSDFGLALSSDFALTDAEREFLGRHRSYDPCRAAVGFCHAISAAHLGDGDWKGNLREWLTTERPPLPPAVASVARRWAPVALAFLEFSRGLLEQSKRTPYPAQALEGLLIQARSEVGAQP